MLEDESTEEKRTQDGPELNRKSEPRSWALASRKLARYQKRVADIVAGRYKPKPITSKSLGFPEYYPDDIPITGPYQYSKVEGRPVHELINLWVWMRLVGDLNPASISDKTQSFLLPPNKTRTRESFELFWDSLYPAERERLRPLWTRRGRPLANRVSGRKLREYRDELNLTQEQLAEECDDDVRTVQRAEASQRLTNDKLICLAETLSRLLGREITVADLKA